MLQAQLRNKLRTADERMEDVLTSSFFGAARYLPAEHLLLPVLALAQNLDGDTLDLGDFCPQLTFWPWLSHGDVGAEPDVVAQDDRWAVTIEVKLHSPKSSRPTMDGPVNDQLARQLVLTEQIDVGSFALVYVTTSSVMPRGDLNEALEELTAKRGVDRSERLYWVSWHQISMLVQTLGSPSLHERLLLKDLGDLLKRHNFGLYSGVDVDFPEVEVSWRLAEADFDWPECLPLYVTWRLEE